LTFQEIVLRIALIFVNFSVKLTNMSLQVYKKSEFSRLAGVSRAAVTKAVQRGEIVEVDGRIDITDPVNASYLASNRDRRPKVDSAKSKPKKRNTTKTKTDLPKFKPKKSKPDKDETPLNISPGDKERYEILKTQAQTASIQLKYAKELKILILRELVEGAFQRLYAVAVNYFLVLGDRLAPILASLCRETDQAVIIEMKSRIDKEVTRALEELKRQTEAEL
jgi:hypothetical protein